jgi:uncharacterized protein (DUF433 family)
LKESLLTRRSANGKPVNRGTRISVTLVVRSLAGGVQAFAMLSTTANFTHAYSQDFADHV